MFLAETYIYPIQCYIIGIPIGAVIQSYDGNISFGLHCDKRAVPDAEKFAEWMLDEYARIKGGE